MDRGNRFRLSLYESPGRAYGWRAWVAWHLLRIGCRHPRGMVCAHRHYEYDFELRGSHSGYSAGVLHERDQARSQSPSPDRRTAH